jgi:hypothetical protein
MVIEGNVIQRHLVDVDIPHGSPVTIIVIAMNMSGLITSVEQRISGVKGIAIVDNVGWVSTESNINGM